MRYRTVPATVPVDRIRCNRRPVAERQGFAGQNIDCFVACRCYRTALEDPLRAAEEFCAWYREWFVEKQIWRFSKAEGGMATGSLMVTVKRLHRERLARQLTRMEEADESLIDEAIQLRVDYHLSLFESVRGRGYDASLAPPIRCRQEDGGLYELVDGHHRTAALRVLGHRWLDVEIVNVPRLGGRRNRAAGSETGSAGREPNAGTEVEER